VSLLLLAAALPGLYFEQMPPAADALRDAGGVRIYAPAADSQAWKAAGFSVADPRELAAYERVPPPAMRMQSNIAEATRAPWIETNAWRFQSGTRRALYANVPAGWAALAAAEAFAYSADAVVQPDAADVGPVARMLQFLSSLPAAPEAPLANIGLVRTKSAALAEVMNLLTRRNLLFRLVDRLDPTLDLNVRPGSAEFPESAAADPSEFAMKVREKLGDDKRLVRLFNTSAVIARITGDEQTIRLHLLNFATRPTREVRVRLRGTFGGGTLHAFGTTSQKLADFTHREGGTEFTIPELNIYAVVDLPRASRTAGVLGRR
jgi:hypothetical protein